ncbi:RagB/SusD family nutrient uptake outer membrane protein [Pedobacter ureilyticus]|uniref:RagB/SusD family nutrient uptake outer membrane protein n=1 Tax=Pedobacter ureilyticus TaxID=1393051 RepID=A0ABW9J898_9SPHI
MKNVIKTGAIITMVLMVSSCKKFIEIDSPKSSITPGAVFRSDDLAVSALLGVYQQMAASGYASGDGSSISTICGAAADELIGFNNTIVPFYDNQLLPENSTLASLWSSMYARIYNLNTLLEGINGKNELSPAVANQLEGEALFARAFHFFYLLNLFGEVPLHLTTDYAVNAGKSRSSSIEVYKQIVSDLKSAEDKLGDNYVSTERVRPNKSAARALLAKVYLYMGDWPKADLYASLVLDQSSLYNLVAFEDIFLKNSREAIWQLMPTAGGNTSAGSLLILTTVPNAVALRPDLAVNGFETGDLRKTNWIRSLVVQGTTYYYPFKYKVRSATSVSEYFMVFRLAEMYLIRAEARAKLDLLALAIDDLDKLRARAGLSLIKTTTPNITREDFLELLLKERRAELFTEWGNRWFDLKRNQKSNQVLSTIKAGWKPTAVLFPIPKLEIDNNKNIIQNEGY